MKQEINEHLQTHMEHFHLPRYEELPDVGLFLEQTVHLVNGYLEPLGDLGLTSSMISNYVKQKLIAPPVKKLYHREQLAYLVFMAIAKTVLSLEDIRMLFALQKNSYSSAVAYDYFCDEFENVLQYIFGNKDTLDKIGQTDTVIKELLRNTTITVAHKIHLTDYFDEIEKNLDAVQSSQILL